MTRIYFASRPALAFLGTLLILSALAARVGAAQANSRESFNGNWRFHKVSPASPLQRTGEPTPSPTDANYAAPTFDDNSWRELNLPHDWGIEGPFDQSLPGENAKLPYSGIGWYRKHFTLPAADKGKQIYLDVDGAMSNAKVWINGHDVGGWPYGYTSWRVDLTPHLKFGGENVLAIRLDNPAKSSRWYPGGGIYRNVWLVKTPKIHVAHWGVRATTSIAEDASATAQFEVKIDNNSPDKQVVAATVHVYELSSNGSRSKYPVAYSVSDISELLPQTTGKLRLSTRFQHPRLWSPEDPHLYVAEVSLKVDGQKVDVYEVVFGFRTIKFTPEEGFLLNGKPYEIQGVCLHHDLGALGAAFNHRARERQLEKLKELGCNAIRASHNPLEPEFYDLADRLGFLVMDEAFDAWQMEKRENDYHLLFDEWAERDLRAMIRRDANHPSVILYSLGNEIYEQRDGKNAPLANKLADIAHDEDPTRPVNMALHVVDASTNGFQNAIDVFGYNYTPFGYAQFRKDNPTIPLIGSETSSCTSTRGEYFFPVNEEDKRSGRFNFQVTSYDYSAPKWAMAPDIEFEGQDENPFVAGEFVWTGFDYLGEPTPYDTDSEEMLKFTDPALEKQAAADFARDEKVHVPSRSSYFGILDLCGFPKDRYYIYQARWRPDLPMAHILPHWNWPERVGQVTPVHVYTSGDEAELFLNGKSLGRKKRGPHDYRFRWSDVVYEPGELKVVAYRDGKKWATDVVRTTGAPAALKIETDRVKVASDGDDLAFVTVTVADKNGDLVPRSKNPLQFTIEGPGEIVAVDNGDATSHESFHRTKINAFNGLALVIVRAKPGETGTIRLRSSSPELKAAALEIAVTATAP